MLEGDWVEHWVSGGVEDHGPNEGGYHATVRSQFLGELLAWFPLLFSILFLGFLSWLFRVIMLVLLLDVVCLGAIRCDWQGGES